MSSRLEKVLREAAARPCRNLGEDSKKAAAGDDSGEDRCMSRLGGTDVDGSRIFYGGICHYAISGDWIGAELKCGYYK